MVYTLREYKGKAFLLFLIWGVVNHTHTSTRTSCPEVRHLLQEFCHTLI